MSMNPAIFLDRDGVIIENSDTYVRSWRDVNFLPSSIEALRKLNPSVYKIVIITNQSAIGRGVISLAQAQEINRRVIDAIVEGGGRIDGLFVCPHSPDDGCTCRKPLPGLILQAAEALSLDLEHSIMIGDAMTDIQSGQAAGIPTNILVKTGRGLTQLQSGPLSLLPRIFVYSDLANAVESILSGSFSQPTNP
jgi:D-glycero-D-manno-heptose 1,7-bisphosphate phosphatase